jgi:hypothetical protein
MPNDDLTLLREYSRSQSESAFALLVERHINLERRNDKKCCRIPRAADIT